jgi:hypothetical protein
MLASLSAIEAPAEAASLPIYAPVGAQGAVTKVAGIPFGKIWARQLRIQRQLQKRQTEQEQQQTEPASEEDE